MIGPSQKQRLYWICQLSGWGLYAVLNAMLINAYVRLPLSSSIGLLSYGLCGILVTHTLRAHIHRRALLSRPWSTIALHIAAMVLFGAVSLTLLIQLCW